MLRNKELEDEPTLAVASATVPKFRKSVEDTFRKEHKASREVFRARNIAPVCCLVLVR